LFFHEQAVLLGTTADCGEGIIHGLPFGANLKNARLAAGVSQAGLAKAAQIPRLRVVRAEQGRYVPNLDEAVRIAGVLRVPLERLTDGQWQPGTDLRAIAYELFHLGVRDLQVAAARVPGAFRPPEQIVAAAVKGDRPEPRVVEAVPVVLARRKLNVQLTLAFGDAYDARVRSRLAWLSDVTLTLSQLSTFPGEVRYEAQLREFVREGIKPAESDSLGHPGGGRQSPIWKRWNITYAGTLADFTRRISEADVASRDSVNTAEYGA
jgi:transcriptional regulator with XRE-family HTH domain